MNPQAENNQSRLDSLIRKISPIFGMDFTNVSYKLSTPSVHFLSDLLLVQIVSNDNEKKKISVAIKKPSAVPDTRSLLKTDTQFHNEILFYTRYAKNSKEFPRCFCAEEKPPVDSVIVLENVIEERGYSMCNAKYDIPLEYTLAMCREIARFHAKAYVAKERHREEFFDVIKNIQEDRFGPESAFRIMVNGTASRSVEYLRKQGYDQRFCDEVEARFENAFDNVFLKALEPDEPLATLCHGDCTINNVVFKREKNESVAMLLDFATIRYGTPTVDLSTFLCLNCANNLDKDTLNNILKVYHDSLIKCLECEGMDCKKYTYEALLEDFKMRALFGFLIASFFLAVQMGKADVKPEIFLTQDVAVTMKQMREAGGDEISKVLSGMLLKLKEFGCLDHLV